MSHQLCQVVVIFFLQCSYLLDFLFEVAIIVAAEIATVEEDIKKVERQLEEAGKRDLTNLSEEEKKEARDEKKYLQEKEKQLRRDKEQLRRDNELLREKENLLLKQASGTTAFVSLLLCTPLTILLLKQRK